MGTSILLQRRYAIAHPNPISTSPGLSDPGAAAIAQARKLRP
ncbi:hypothetical protein [Moorena producens]|nr:hypothetical protein [Moorena producens]